MSAIGHDGTALLCITNKPGCCNGGTEGWWISPNGEAIPTAEKPDSVIIQQFGMQYVQLEQQGGAQPNTGIYQCNITNAVNQQKVFYVGIFADTMCKLLYDHFKFLL